MGRRAKLPTAEEFVESWERGNSVDEVTDTLCEAGYDMDKRRVRRWATTLRELKVKLKKMPPDFNMLEGVFLNVYYVRGYSPKLWRFES